MASIHQWLQQFSLARDNKTFIDIAEKALLDFYKAGDVCIQLYGDAADAEQIPPAINVLQAKYRFKQLHPTETLSHLFSPPNAGKVNYGALLPVRTHQPIGIIILWYSLESLPQLTDLNEFLSFSEVELALAEVLLDAIALTWEQLQVQISLTHQLAEKNAELLENKLAFEQAERVKNRFLSATSHDLRQPLQQINVLTGLLIKQILHAENIKLLKRIRFLIADMDNVLRTLLNLDRLTQGIVIPENCSFSLQSILDSLTEDFQSEAELKGLKLNIIQSDALVYCDRSLLLQILRNLLSNAIKYTDKGTVSVKVSTASDNTYISVIDTGAGIHANQQEIMFEPFCQLNENQDDMSFGLGLSIVKGLCETLNIPIHVTSRPGQGSEFNLCIANCSLTQDQRNQAGQPVLTTETNKQYCLLYLEDDNILAESMTLLLQMANFDVICAPGLEQAMVLLADNPRQPDLILSDKKLLNGADGIAAIRHIRAVYDTHIPALLLTGYSENTIINQALKDVQKVLVKPIDVDHLVAEIKQLLPGC